MTFADYLVLFAAAAGAGAVNAVAGGGTLISFPVLLGMGVPAIAANVTNAIALCPGYLGAAHSQRVHIHEQRHRLRVCLPAGLIGGLAGAALLLRTEERVFAMLVPFMLALGSLLLAIQDLVKRFAIRRATEHHREAAAWTAIAVCAAAVYGGFFSAGMSVIVLAVLALTVDDTFTRLNALKQITALAVNVAASIFFLFSDQVIWGAAGVMAIGALLGGAIGGRLVSRLHPTALRWIVVIVGFGLAVYYWMKE